MQTYNVELKSDVSKTFRCQRAANSLDIDTEKKSVHKLEVSANLNSPFNLGLILGASGSGKTTLAKQIFGNDCFDIRIDPEIPIIDQLPEELNYDECAGILSGIGLTSVPCWIRPVKTLSNGQRARAEAALGMLKSMGTVILDEWTSVVDRTVGKVMSHCVQKFARKNNKSIILLSCHYDVVEWLDPDWIIDCNSQSFIDRRLLCPEERKRKESIEFDVKRVGRDTWKYFSKYHYLSERLPGGAIQTFGLFHGLNQIGFQCFANYVPFRRDIMPKMLMHSNRTVIHPDYAGMGLGIHLINKTSEIMASEFKVMAKFSSVPIYRSMIKNPAWKLVETKRQIGRTLSGKASNFGRSLNRNTGGGFRENVKTFSFEYVGKRAEKA